MEHESSGGPVGGQPEAGHLGADQKLLIIAFRTGRLGNRWLRFAHVIGFAAEHGCRVVNVAFHSYAHLFENTRRDIYCRYPVARRWSLFDPMMSRRPFARRGFSTSSSAAPASGMTVFRSWVKACSRPRDSRADRFSGHAGSAIPDGRCQNCFCPWLADSRA
jgi:hypothetical protein